MNPIQITSYPFMYKSLFLIFAWIAIIALSFTIVSDFWLPMLIGAIAITVLIKLMR